MSKLVGQKLKGYQITRYIGTGNYGGVYQATHPTIPVPVVVKVLHKRHLNNAEVTQRFEAEADVITRLNKHPNVVPLYDYWRDDEGAYLVLHYLGGGSLRDRLIDRRALPIGDVLCIMDKLMDALAYAHDQGVIHRDLKPENVLFDEAGTVFLADFGIAKQINLNITQSPTVLGTPGYLAPEQILARPVSPQTDIYALGIMLYECLVGERPFTDKQAFNVLIKHLKEPMPPFLHHDRVFQQQMNPIIQKATAKDARQRYSRVLDMAAELRLVAVH